MKLQIVLIFIKHLKINLIRRKKGKFITNTVHSNDNSYAENNLQIFYFKMISDSVLYFMNKRVMLYKIYNNFDFLYNIIMNSEQFLIKV